MLACRQPPTADIPDAPDGFLVCPAALAVTLKGVQLDLDRDQIEWECINDL